MMRLPMWIASAGAVAVVLCALAGGVAAGAFEDGNAASERVEHEEAFRIWLPLAQNGDARAQYQLGVAFSAGWGVPRDIVQAHQWFNRAAIGGHTRAAKARTLLYFHMTPAQIAEAQRLAREWRPKLE